MTTIDTLLQDPAARAIGWALVHFIWQGTLVGVFAAAVLALLRRSDADVRYVVASIALAVMATLPMVTAFQAYEGVGEVATAERALASRGAPVATAALVTAESPLPAEVPRAAASPRFTMPDVEPWVPVAFVVWLAGVAILTLRLLTGWVRVQRMKSHGTRVAGDALQASVVRLSKRLHLYRPVRLLEASGVDVPMVIGCLKPVILLPVSALAGLSHAQVEAILAHELAHIRRHDYLVNLLQTLLETLLFYHPAVWWLSKRIRAERENCCDDLAVSLCGDPVAYARALADLEELRGPRGHLVLAASGGPLLQRVRRLLLPAPAAHDDRGPVWLAAATALALVCGISVAALAQVGEAPVSEMVTGQDPVPPPPPVPPVSPAPPASPAPAPPPPVAAAAAPPAPGAPAVPPVPPPAEAAPALPAPHAPAPPPAPPAMPAPPAVPVPDALPAPPAPPAPAQPMRKSGNHVSWSNNGEKFEIRWDGELEFSDDDTDVKRMSPGAQIRISDGGWFRGRSVELSADASGNITRRYWVGSGERPFDPEGKQWLAQMLPRFIRQSGIGAAGRVARFYRSGGTNAVLGEISRIDGSWAKKVYFNELFKLNIDAAGRRRALEQAGREISSDYEMATLLIDNGDSFFSDAGTRQAYFAAARNIKSDYEMGRVFSAALKRGPLDNALLGSMLDAARAIDSDHEMASLLVRVAKLQSIEPVRAAFFAAVESLNSDYEQGRVLLAVAAQAKLANETILAVLHSVKAMKSGYEASRVLQTLAANNILTGPARDAYIDATDTLGDYEQGRALNALVKSDRARK